jgi:hypothetical protein
VAIGRLLVVMSRAQPPDVALIGDLSSGETRALSHQRPFTGYQPRACMHLAE